VALRNSTASKSELGFTELLFNRYWGSFSRVKWPDGGHKLPPSSAEVTNGGSTTPFRPCVNSVIITIIIIKKIHGFSP
jgi:hypothetical protein